MKTRNYIIRELVHWFLYQEDQIHARLCNQFPLRKPVIHHSAQPKRLDYPNTLHRYHYKCRFPRNCLNLNGIVIPKECQRKNVTLTYDDDISVLDVCLALSGQSLRVGSSGAVSLSVLISLHGAMLLRLVSDGRWQKTPQSRINGAAL